MNLREEDAMRNIDIGGVSLIRAAAKNFKNVKLAVDPDDYQGNIDSWILGYREDLNRYLARNVCRKYNKME